MLFLLHGSTQFVRVAGRGGVVIRWARTRVAIRPRRFRCAVTLDFPLWCGRVVGLRFARTRGFVCRSGGRRSGGSFAGISVLLGIATFWRVMFWGVALIRLALILAARFGLLLPLRLRGGVGLFLALRGRLFMRLRGLRLTLRLRFLVLSLGLRLLFVLRLFLRLFGLGFSLGLGFLVLLRLVAGLLTIRLRLCVLLARLFVVVVSLLFFLPFLLTLLLFLLLFLLLLLLLLQNYLLLLRICLCNNDLRDDQRDAGHNGRCGLQYATHVGSFSDGRVKSVAP
ncbi:hypothetical protein [Paracoccus aestuariivivens]|uniref:hypothetical protein n=1 Tax=Paracoccus aestuariivivens TaxID=1820333 RepID=UPI001FE85AD9|nr:hypothetical protein [Paracoccus aestuariivivens]